MKITAVVCANNRPDYLATVLISMGRFLPPMPVIIQNDGQHEGMAANIQHGFDRFLETDSDYVMWVEDDMELIAPIPVNRFAAILKADKTLTQVVAKRHPWSAAEHETGDVIQATCDEAEHWTVEKDYTTQDHIFSLNPCLIPRAVIELGWPAGPLGEGNESGMTAKLKGLGHRFAFYGHAGDPPLVNHIGQDRGEGWKL